MLVEDYMEMTINEEKSKSDSSRSISMLALLTARAKEYTILACPNWLEFYFNASETGALHKVGSGSHVIYAGPTR